jgi:hypothetical protein
MKLAAGALYPNIRSSMDCIDNKTPFHRKIPQRLLSVLFVHSRTLLHPAGRPIAVAHGEVVAVQASLGGAMPEQVDGVEGEGDGKQDAAFQSGITPAAGRPNKLTN